MRCVNRVVLILFFLGLGYQFLRTIPAGAAIDLALVEFLGGAAWGIPVALAWPGLHPNTQRGW